MKSRFEGFTLVEILVVIVLVSLLAIFSLINIPTQIAKARDAERKGDIDTIGKFVEEYFVDKGCYPVSIPTCGSAFSLGDKTYISTLPCDPKTKLSYVYVSEISSCPSWFQLYGNLEYTEDSIIDKLGCRNGCGPKCQFNYGTASTNVKLNPLCYDVIPTQTPKPTPATKLQYVCSPSGSCEVFQFPELSGCPDIYLNDSTCQNQCSTPKNRCHDSRGKTN